MRSLKPDLTTSQDLSSAALDYTTTISKACKLDEIQFHVDANITETITVKINSAHGASYDTKLRTIPLTSSADAVWMPERECNLQAGDEIDINCTNANGTGTIYCTIKTSELVGG